MQQFTCLGLPPGPTSLGRQAGVLHKSTICREFSEDARRQIGADCKAAEKQILCQEKVLSETAFACHRMEEANSRLKSSSFPIIIHAHSSPIQNAGSLVPILSSDLPQRERISVAYLDHPLKITLQTHVRSPVGMNANEFLEKQPSDPRSTYMPLITQNLAPHTQS